MSKSSCLLIKILSQPKLVEKLSLKDVETALRQAISCDLHATLFDILKSSGVNTTSLPQDVIKHFDSINNVAKAHVNFVQWEVGVLEGLFLNQKIPLILLKGAAYTIAELPSGKGRLYGDIDLLVKKESLSEVELLLKKGLWLPKRIDDYDERYYRQWMHELPPLQHVQRRSVLDVHHTILPETSKPKLDPAKLINAIVPVAGTQNIYVLAPCDMVLHSATHLFYEGEFEHGLRDLVDLDLLLRDFSRSGNNFWDELITRSFELDLGRPLYYALRYTKLLLGTPVPSAILQKTEQVQPYLPGLMDFFFSRALMPVHISCNDSFTGFARWVLYLRAHYLRMPLYLLIPHLLRKAYMGWSKDKKKKTS